MTNGGGPDIVGHFREGLDVLRRYPTLIVPEVAVQVVVFVLTLVLLGGAAALFLVGGVAGGVVGAVGAGLLFVVVSGVLSLVASGVVIVMARDALAGRDPALGDAVGTVMGRLVDVLVASVIAMIVVGVGMLLLVLPGIVAGFFLIFTLPAVLLDGDSGVDALKRSFGVVKANLRPVVGLVIGWIVTGVGLVIAGKILGFVPVLGQLAAAILFGAGLAYLTVVTVRVYQTLPRR